MTARSERPTSREISWVRPPIRPLTDSRSVRVLVARGSIAYSAVTQPCPVPLRQRGTPSVKRRRAQHPGAAELDQHAALGVVEPAPGDPDRRAAGRARAAVGRAGAAVPSATCGRRRPPTPAGRRTATRPPTTSYTAARARRARSARRRPRAASARARCGSFHGGRWVSTSRPTPRGGRGLRRRGAGQVHAAHVVAALEERRLGEQQVGVPGELDQRVAGVGVAAVGEHRARVLDPAARTPRPGARPARGVTVNGPIAHRRALAASRGRRTPRSSPGPLGQAVGLRQPLERCPRGRRPAPARRRPSGCVAGARRTARTGPGSGRGAGG